MRHRPTTPTPDDAPTTTTGPRRLRRACRRPPPRCWGDAGCSPWWPGPGPAWPSPCAACRRTTRPARPRPPRRRPPPPPPRAAPAAHPLRAAPGRPRRRGRWHPPGDRGALPRRRVERARRPPGVGRRAQRHHPQHRVGVGGGRGRGPDHDPHRRRRFHRRPLAGQRPVPVALHPRGRLLDVQRRCGGRELPPGRAGGGLGRQPDLPDDLPRVLRRALAPHALRGLRRPATATSSGDIRRTSQLAFPQDVCETVYAEEGYDASASNLSGVSLDSDGIFADGVDQQMVTISGSPSAGYTATLTVAV